MNYLALGALHKVRLGAFFAESWYLFKMEQTYAAQEGPYQSRAKEIYNELRKNVIDNVFKVCFRFSL